MSGAAADRASLRERIALLDRRVEHRRQRLREDAHEAKAAARASAARWLPVAAAAGAGLAMLWLVRRGSPARTAPSAAYEAALARRGVRWASLLGIASTAYKLASSPAGREIIAAVRRRVARSR